MLRETSTGDNTLALVGAGAKRVIAAGLSPPQAACLELRVSAYRNLRHAEFLELLGQNRSKRRDLSTSVLSRSETGHRGRD